ncbi:MAG: hypothetical protein ACLQQ4_16385 [Bacteroidia bacterium]
MSEPNEEEEKPVDFVPQFDVFGLPVQKNEVKEPSSEESGLKDDTDEELDKKVQESSTSDMSKCFYCKSSGLTEHDKFCPHCGFPQRGTEQQKRTFMIKIKYTKEELGAVKKKINRARNVLYFLAGLNIVLGIAISFTMQNQAAIIIASVIIGGIFFGLGLWCNRNPFPAILTGFFVYIVLLVIEGVFDPLSIFKGIFLKIFVISAFIYGYRAVKDAEKMEEELALTNTSIDLNDANEEVSVLPGGEPE